MFGGNLGTEKFVEMWRRRELSHPRNTRTASRIFEIGDDAGRCVRRGERGHGLCRGLSFFLKYGAVQPSSQGRRGLALGSLAERS